MSLFYHILPPYNARIKKNARAAKANITASAFKMFANVSSDPDFLYAINFLFILIIHKRKNNTLRRDYKKLTKRGKNISK